MCAWPGEGHKHPAIGEAFLTSIHLQSNPKYAISQNKHILRLILPAVIAMLSARNDDDGDHENDDEQSEAEKIQVEEEEAGEEDPEP